MPRDGNITRDKILKTSMGLAISQGHVATPIDQVIAQVGITKGTFFYHFPSKKHLAKAMIEKFSNSKLDTLIDYFAKANKLSNDPLQQLLIFVGLIQEQHAQLEQEEIGCLYASYCYENQLVDKEIEEMVSSTMQEWKDKFSNKLKEIMAVYRPVIDINPEQVAGLFLTTLEGAYIMARIMPERDAVETYLEQYKTYLQVLFKQP
ncbi:MAG: TetR/AcrR family transcriptional repressor of nem operon [Methylophagaceae bacterium]|jgi:TetR/AcrR family transcriptional repressor of nem operon